jgi:hypothetical protein
LHLGGFFYVARLVPGVLVNFPFRISDRAEGSCTDTITKRRLMENCSFFAIRCFVFCLFLCCFGRSIFSFGRHGDAYGVKDKNTWYQSRNDEKSFSDSAEETFWKNDNARALQLDAKKKVS